MKLEISTKQFNQIQDEVIKLEEEVMLLWDNDDAHGPKKEYLN
jgi:hypothetical protein